MVAGQGEGKTELTAFDAALIDAGVSHYNLVKLSSIMPPDAQPSRDLQRDVPPGSLLPIAYGFITSSKPGQVISAAVAVGVTGNTYGMIMEYKAAAPREEVEEKVMGMAREALARRGLPCKEVLLSSAEHRVKDIGCAFAGVALWR